MPNHVTRDEKVILRMPETIQQEKTGIERKPYGDECRKRKI